jgi:hypothetical protein
VSCPCEINQPFFAYLLTIMAFDWFVGQRFRNTFVLRRVPIWESAL